jgi:hypothetical protein
MHSVSLHSSVAGSWVLKRDDGETHLVQVDYEFPALARALGWDMREVQRCAYKHKVYEDAGLSVSALHGKGTMVWNCYQCERPFIACLHRGTDGTVTCRECGIEASSFIRAAERWLEDNDGYDFELAEDSGYF